MKKKKIYQDYSKITNATKWNKNIILIAGAIILVGLLYYMLSPYQQCVRGYVSTISGNQQNVLKSRIGLPIKHYRILKVMLVWFAIEINS